MGKGSLAAYAARSVLRMAMALYGSSLVKELTSSPSGTESTPAISAFGGMQWNGQTLRQAIDGLDFRARRAFYDNLYLGMGSPHGS